MKNTDEPIATAAPTFKELKRPRIDPYRRNYVPREATISMTSTTAAKPPRPVDRIMSALASAWPEPLTNAQLGKEADCKANCVHGNIKSRIKNGEILKVEIGIGAKTRAGYKLAKPAGEQPEQKPEIAETEDPKTCEICGFALDDYDGETTCSACLVERIEAGKHNADADNAIPEHAAVQLHKQRKPPREKTLDIMDDLTTVESITWAQQPIDQGEPESRITLAVSSDDQNACDISIEGKIRVVAADLHALAIIAESLSDKRTFPA